MDCCTIAGDGIAELSPLIPLLFVAAFVKGLEAVRLVPGWDDGAKCIVRPPKKMIY